MANLTSPRVKVSDDLAAMEHAWDQGWTDGLPIVPPTPERVEAFLNYAGLEPDYEIGKYSVRNRGISAEKIAINAVMAGCEPEYLPVVVAAVEGITDDDFHMNHMASTSSPWPAFVVNGPIVDEIGLESGRYVLGPGNKPNITIGRAISLTMANCMEAKVGGVQQGVLGIPSRVCGHVVAENEHTSWEPLSAMRGVPKGVSAVTVAAHFMGGPEQVLAHPKSCYPDAKSLASLIAAYYPEFNTAGFSGTHLVIISPGMQRAFAADGWSKQDLADYLTANTKLSFARLKRLGWWEPRPGETVLPDGTSAVLPSDYHKHLYFGRMEQPYQDEIPEGLVTWGAAPQKREEGPPKASARATRGINRPSQFLIAVAGADTGDMYAILFRSYSTGPNSVIKEVRSAKAAGA